MKRLVEIFISIIRIIYYIRYIIEKFNQKK